MALREVGVLLRAFQGEGECEGQEFWVGGEYGWGCSTQILIGVVVHNVFF